MQTELMHSLQTLERRSRKSARRGFTITEILVVIGLMVLLLTLAMPAFNFMSGSTSIEGTGNVVSSLLARVRQDAIATQQKRGLVIYRDVDQDRLLAAFIDEKDLTQQWVGTNTYKVGDYVYFGTPPVYYVCIQPSKGKQPGGLYPAQNYWRKINNTYQQVNAIQSIYPVMDLIQYSEVVPMPKVGDIRGIGGQIRDGVTEKFIRYSNPTVILFDGDGKVISSRYSILSDGILGDYGKFPPLQLSNNPTLPSGAGTVTVSANEVLNLSQPGLTLFKYEDLKNQNYAVGSDPEATWLAENARPYLINRYNGTLMKGE